MIISDQFVLNVKKYTDLSEDTNLFFFYIGFSEHEIPIQMRVQPAANAAPPSTAVNGGATSAPRHPGASLVAAAAENRPRKMLALSFVLQELGHSICN